jgi:hypothetical protein
LGRPPARAFSLADSPAEFCVTLYNEFVARGWESKSVEDQIESARQDATAPTHLRKNPDEQARDRERELLRLMRTFTQQKLDAAENPRYREQLTRALADIDVKLATLGPEG